MGHLGEDSSICNNSIRPTFCIDCKQGYSLEPLQDSAEAMILFNETIGYKTRPGTTCLKTCDVPNCDRCIVNNIQACETCQFGYTLNNSKKCDKNSCLCENGVATSECSVDGMTSCQTCTDGFVLDKSNQQRSCKLPTAAISIELEFKTEDDWDDDYKDPNSPKFKSYIEQFSKDFTEWSNSTFSDNKRVIWKHDPEIPEKIIEQIRLVPILGGSDRSSDGRTNSTDDLNRLTRVSKSHSRKTRSIHDTVKIVLPDVSVEYSQGSDTADKAKIAEQILQEVKSTLEDAAKDTSSTSTSIFSGLTLPVLKTSAISLDDVTSCATYHHYDNKESKCILNTCSCEHGTAVAQNTCDANLLIKCNSCDTGYHLGPKNLTDNSIECLPNQCNCVGGTPVHYKSCTENGTNQCETCDKGFDFIASTKSCKQNVCKCENGSAATGPECERNNAEMCGSCINTHMLQDKYCVSKCSCQNGVSASSCTSSGIQSCISCNPGYYLSNGNCLINKCLCENGIPQESPECTSNGDKKCSRCNKGYSLNDDKISCKLNVCECDNGEPSKDGKCPRDGMEYCETCDEDYYLWTDAKCRDDEPSTPSYEESTSSSNLIISTSAYGLFQMLCLVILNYFR